MRERHLAVDGGGRRIAWTEWGDPGNPAVLLCVHGLTRSGRDFDALARVLQDGWRVVCPDVAGRRRSGHLPPDRYRIDTYVADAAALVRALRPATLDWVGTSMGGLIALGYAAAQPEGAPPIRRLVLNDVGPEVPRAALDRIGEYVGRDWTFPDIAAAENHVRAAYAPFGLRSDADWRWFTEAGVRALPGGGYAFAYDPAIGDAFRTGPPPEPAAGWALWDALELPVLVLQGERSDVLPDGIAGRMARSGPRAHRHVVRGVGHAPSLLYPDETGPVEGFLREGARAL